MTPPVKIRQSCQEGRRALEVHRTNGPGSKAPSALMRASHSCSSPKVYPVGIPTVYAIILWKNREILNPQQQSSAPSQTARDGEQDVSIARRLRSWMKTKAPRSSEDATKKSDKRRLVPELAPSMLLWKDYCEFSPEMGLAASMGRTSSG